MPMTRLTVYAVFDGPMPVRSPTFFTAAERAGCPAAERGVLPRRAVGEDDDVAAVHGRVGAVDEDPVADPQRLLHRLRRHPERLDEERLDEGDGDDGEEDLEAHREPATLPLGPLAGSSHSRGGAYAADAPSQRPSERRGVVLNARPPLGHPWGMVALIIGMLICVGLALAVVALVAVPARRDGRSILTPKGEEVVIALKERQQSARERLDRGDGDGDRRRRPPADRRRGRRPAAPLTAEPADASARA